MRLLTHDIEQISLWIKNYILFYIYLYIAFGSIDH